jgi:hypothetical protein
MSNETKRNRERDDNKKIIIIRKEKKKKEKDGDQKQRIKERDDRLEIEEMEKEIPGWNARSCSLGKMNKLQLRKMKRLKFGEDRL